MEPATLIPLKDSISTHAAVRIGGNASGTPIIFLHSFSTSGELYKPQFESALKQNYRLIAIDLLGHGDTAGIADELNYWDQAKMVLNVMEELNVKAAFVLGTSQGGFVAARMALLEPEKVLGMILCGTSLKCETNLLGCWDIDALLAGALPVLQSTTPTPDFVLPQPFTDDVIRSGFNDKASEADKILWRSVHEKVFVGDEGRRRYLMIILCLRNRDDLTSAQLAKITCPVYIVHGTGDIVYGVPLTKLWAAELVNAKVEMKIIEDGTHFLSATSASEVNEIVLEFVGKYGKAQL